MNKSTIIELEKLISKEITEHKLLIKNKKSVSNEFANGFIAGLTQAKTLLNICKLTVDEK